MSKRTRKALRDCLAIDREDLENEICQQPILLQRAVDQRARKQAAFYEARDAYREQQALTAAYIRDTYEKMTAAEMKAEVDSAEEVIAARDLARAAEVAKDKAEHTYNVFMQRGYLLRSLADMATTGYHQTPK